MSRLLRPFALLFAAAAPGLGQSSFPVKLAFVTPEHAVPGTELVVEIFGQRQFTQMLESCLYDPMNLLVKGWA